MIDVYTYISLHGLFDNGYENIVACRSTEPSEYIGSTHSIGSTNSFAIVSVG